MLGVAIVALRRCIRQEYSIYRSTQHRVRLNYLFFKESVAIGEEAYAPSVTDCLLQIITTGYVVTEFLAVNAIDGLLPRILSRQSLRDRGQQGED